MKESIMGKADDKAAAAQKAEDDFRAETEARIAKLKADAEAALDQDWNKD
jgi:hypothetical protein